MDQNIKREIDSMKRFRHPHIVKLYEVIETQADVFMVMEYVDGGELFDFIVSNGKLSEDTARYYFQQIISAVSYCHKHKVVHRDLKPENLLLDSVNNTIKIADFGLSTIIVDGDFLKTSCGSPNYAAPEVISAKLYTGPEVDVWSCGVILYALLTGRLPFDDDYIPLLFTKIKEGKYVMPEYLSDSCKDLISKMLIVDPLRRISILDIKKHPWFKVSYPRYLELYPEEETAMDLKYLEPHVINELELKYQIPRDRLVREIIMRGEESESSKEMVVAYRLLYDAGGYSMRDSTAADEASLISRSLAELSMSPPVALTDTPRPSDAALTDVPVSALVQEYMQDKDPLSDDSGPPSRGSDLNAAQLTQSRDWHDENSRRWYLGLMSSHSADTIMAEVFRVLKRFRFEWKKTGPYQLRCRRVTHREDQVHVVKIVLQLFKINDSKSHKKNKRSYLLDIKKAEGETFTFMELCAKFIAEFQL
jgi:5'-AMP-activated protein kinase catalytic alpha subunit